MLYFCDCCFGCCCMTMQKQQHVSFIYRQTYTCHFGEHKQRRYPRLLLPYFDKATTKKKQATPHNINQAIKSFGLHQNLPVIEL